MEQESSSDRHARIMNVREVAAYLRISEAKVYRMARAGDVPVIRMGKSWRFRSDLIDEWIRRQAEITYQTSR